MHGLYVLCVCAYVTANKGNDMRELLCVVNPDYIISNERVKTRKNKYYKLRGFKIFEIF